MLAPSVDAPVIEGERDAPPPDLADWEVALYQRGQPLVPPAPPVRLDTRVLACSTGAAALAVVGVVHAQEYVTLLHVVSWIGPLFQGIVGAL